MDSFVGSADEIDTVLSSILETVEGLLFSEGIPGAERIGAGTVVDDASPGSSVAVSMLEKSVLGDAVIEFEGITVTDISELLVMLVGLSISVE